MSKIKEFERRIEGVDVDTYMKKFERSEASIVAEVGTNGFVDDDSRAYFRLEMLEGGSFASLRRDDHGNPCGFEFAVGGEDSLLTTLEAVCFIAKTLTALVIMETLGNGTK